MYKDLKELDGILSKNDELGNMASKVLSAASRTKKKKL